MATYQPQACPPDPASPDCSSGGANSQKLVPRPYGKKSFRFLGTRPQTVCQHLRWHHFAVQMSRSGVNIMSFHSYTMVPDFSPPSS